MIPWGFINEWFMDQGFAGMSIAYVAHSLREAHALLDDHDYRGKPAWILSRSWWDEQLRLRREMLRQRGKAALDRAHRRAENDWSRCLAPPCRPHPDRRHATPPGKSSNHQPCNWMAP